MHPGDAIVKPWGFFNCEEKGPCFTLGVVARSSFNNFCCVCLILFVQGTTRSTYARDSYWLSSVCLQQRIDQGSFSSIQEMRDEVANLHSIAQRSNMENKVIKHWLDLLNFLNMLLQNIGNQPQGWALQQIREKFGTNCGISKKKKKLADKIIRDNLRNQISTCAPPMMSQTFLPMGGVLSALPAPPMAMFQQHMRPDPRILQPFQTQQNLGPCFNCNQAGHLARNCPFPQRSARSNARPNNKKFEPKTFGKKK